MKLKIATIASALMVNGLAFADTNTNYEELHFIEALEVNQSISNGVETSVIQSSIKAIEVLKKETYQVSSDNEVTLLSYINLDGFACVQYVKYANEITLFDGKRSTDKNVGTSYLINEYCAPKVERNGGIYPHGLAALVDVTDNKQAQWQYPVFY